MYGKAAVLSGTLPFTGAFLGLSWVVLAAVTALMVGLALVRLVPRREG